MSPTLANWRTTLSGFLEEAAFILTCLSAAPYELGEVAEIIAPAWKPTLFAFGLGCKGIAGLMNRYLQKDAVVAGNGSKDDPNRVRDPETDRSRFLPFVLIAAVVGLMFTACTPPPGWSAPRFQVGVTGRTGTHYGVGYDGKTVALDLRLPDEIALRK